MPKLPLSVTLDQENLLWLRTQMATARRRSLSETLDQLVTDARRGGRVAEGTMRSVMGTIDISDADPELLEADIYVREQFSRSARPRFATRKRRAEPLASKQRKSRTR